MEEQIQVPLESIVYPPYPKDDERSKVTMVFKKKNNNSHGDVNVRQKLNSGDSDEDNRHSGDEELVPGSKKESLKRRLSTEVMVKETERSNSPKVDENSKTISYPTAVPFCLPKDSEDTSKYQDIIKASELELKDIRLPQLTSERDRSISVDRSSSSSSREDVNPKKTCGDSGEKRLVDTKDVEKGKESSHGDDRKGELSEGKRSRSKFSASRSISRSPSKHRRRESPPRHRSRDRHRDRSPRKSSHNRRSRSRSPRRHSRDRTRRSRSRGRRSRSRGYRSRSRDRYGNRTRRHRSRSYERRRYRDRSSSRDRYRKRRRSPSSSRSRSRGRSTHDRSKGRLTGLDKVASLTLSSTAGPMTPQMALQQTMAAMSAKAQALTGIELPKYYNPAAVNPLKYAEQVQKRKLLWETKKETTQEQPKNSVWDKLTFQQDQDGKMTEKFRKLMGIKNANNMDEKSKDDIPEIPKESGALQNQEELFRNLDQQYEMARMSTHTHRGVGLGYSSQAIFPPLQKP